MQGFDAIAILMLAGFTCIVLDKLLFNFKLLIYQMFFVDLDIYQFILFHLELLYKLNILRFVCKYSFYNHLHHTERKNHAPLINYEQILLSGSSLDVSHYSFI